MLEGHKVCILGKPGNHNKNLCFTFEDGGPSLKTMDISDQMRLDIGNGCISAEEVVEVLWT